MGILNKLMFWKRDDDFDFDNLAEKEMKGDLGGPDPLGIEQKTPGLEEKSPFDEMPTTEAHPELGEQANLSSPMDPAAITSPQTPQAPGTEMRDLELISSKLDTIKAILTSMDQRVANLERAAGVEKKEQRLW